HDLGKKFAEINPISGYFGKAEWLKYGISIKNIPDISLRMHAAYLKANGAAILTLIPEHINELKLDIVSFNEWLANYKKNISTNYTLLPSQFLWSHQKEPTDKLVEKYQSSTVHWHLLYKSLNQETLSRAFDISKAEKVIKKQGFEIPHLIDVVVSVL